MSDLIDRQAAISAICNACGKIDCDKIDKCKKLQLPPVNNSEIPNSSDTISRAKAIEICDHAIDLLKGQFGAGALVAIKESIEELPPTQPSTGDCWGCNCPKMERLAQPAPSQVAKDIARIVENGQDMRVIAQGRIRGRWIPMERKNLFRCSECGAVIYSESEYDRNEFYKFCGRCGADMRGEQNG